MPLKRAFREPKSVQKEKVNLDSCIPRVTQYATKVFVFTS